MSCETVFSKNHGNVVFNRNVNKIHFTNKSYQVAFKKTESAKPQISNRINSISFSNVAKKVTLNRKVNKIIISKVGAQGRAGSGVIDGGLQRQILSKIDGTDGNVEWRYTWEMLVFNAKYTGTKVTIATGKVYTYSFIGNTYYRFINSTKDSVGYSIQDSFYTDFDGTNLSGLVVTRG